MDHIIDFLDFREGRAWVYQHGHFAVIDTNGKRYTEYEFIEPQPFEPSGYAIAQKDQFHYYLIDKEGHVSEPYRYILPTNNDWYKVRKADLYTFLDRQGQRVPGWDWMEFIGTFSEGRAFVKKDGKWSIVDKIGRILIALDIDMDRPEYFLPGVAGFEKDGKVGYISKTGQVIEPQFVSMYDYTEALKLVRKDEHWGLINMSGEIVLPVEFDAVDPLYDDIAVVKKNGKEGLIDRNGRIVAAPQFHGLAECFEGLIKFIEGGQSGFLDRNARVAIVPQFDLAGYFSEGLVRVLKNGRWGYADQKGHMVIPVQFEKAGDFKEGLAIVQNDGKWGYADKKGALAIRPQFEEAHKFSEGLAAVKQGGKWGFIDKNGQLVVTCQFDVAMPFSQGFAWVSNDEKWGLLNGQGQLLIPTQLDMPVSHSNEEYLATAFLGNQIVLIDHSGQMHPAPKFLSDGQYYEGLTQVSINGKTGFVDKNFQMVIPPRFETGGNFKNGEALVGFGEELFRINKKGEIIVEEGK